MRTEIEYGRHVVVAAIFDRKLAWYASEKEFWILDQKKWARAFSESGYAVSEDDYSERFDLPVVNERTATEFLKAIREDAITEHELQRLLRMNDLSAWDNFSHLMPSLLVDFDRRELHSYYPEPVEFEKYVPEGWSGRYGPFFHLVPEVDRYWVVDGVDLLSRHPASGKIAGLNPRGSG